MGWRENSTKFNNSAHNRAIVFTNFVLQIQCFLRKKMNLVFFPLLVIERFFFYLQENICCGKSTYMANQCND